MGDHVDLSALPEKVADAIRALVSAARGDLTDQSRESLGDLIHAAEAVKGFADAVSLDATQALVDDVVADHGVPADDPWYAARLAAHRRQAGHAVVHEVQLLTGSTLPAARDRVRFATALSVRTSSARDGLRSGQCTWEWARVAYAETAHLDPVLAGEVIDRLLAPPDRTHGDTGVPLSHNGFRARIRRQLALVESAAAAAGRRHTDAVAARDTVTFGGRDETATLQVDGDTARVCAAQQRITTLARAARAAGDDRTLAQLRADIATDLLIYGTVPGVHRGHHNAKTGRFWTSTQYDDASITWATLTRHVTTTAYNHHRAADHAPPNPSSAERIAGKHIARTHENDLLPSIFNALADHQLAATPMRGCREPDPPAPF